MSQQDNGVLQIVFCATGYDRNPPLKLVVKDLMHDSEITYLEWQFRGYRRWRLKMLKGFKATRLGETVTFEIKPRPHRRNLATSPQAINELAQMIASAMGRHGFELHDSYRERPRRVSFTYLSPERWTADHKSLPVQGTTSQTL